MSSRDGGQDRVDPETSERLAVALFEAIAANDLERLRRDIYAPDVQVWHNTDRQSQGVDQNLKVLNWLARNVHQRRYEAVRRQPTPTGFVQQHVLKGVAPDGREVDIPACLVITIRADRITRIEEYIDSAAVASIAG